jgi:hypothetical protein
MNMFKVPVAKRWCYTIYFEEVAGMGTFAHCDIHTKWSKLTKQMLLSGWHLVNTAHGGPIYAEHDPKDKKHEKFLNMFGFVHHKNLKDGKQIWLWRKKDG